MIRVAVVDDHPLFRDGVTQTLQAACDIEVVGQGASPEDAIRIGREFTPDVMTLDMNLAATALMRWRRSPLARPWSAF